MQKIKQIITNGLESKKGKEVLIVIIVILVGLGSFELGRLSKNPSSGVKVEYPSQDLSFVSGQTASAVLGTQDVKTSNKVAPSVNTSPKNFFASTRGKKYYPVGCPAGKSLKMENRIYFATREEAQNAGYELSSSCR